jgi:predicted TIM-barrel fold metal-dependent hydrolase
MHAAWPLRDETIYVLYMHPQLYDHVCDLVEAGFGKRIMFGSDGGPQFLEQGIEAIEQAPFLDESQKRDILYDNAARFFRLEGAPPA